jgi:hypothetical protein
MVSITTRPSSPSQPENSSSGFAWPDWRAAARLFPALSESAGASGQIKSPRVNVTHGLHGKLEKLLS